MLVGLTALSVEISTKVSTPELTADSAHIFVPRMLLRTASKGFSSTIETCL